MCDIEIHLEVEASRELGAERSRGGDLCAALIIIVRYTGTEDYKSQEAGVLTLRCTALARLSSCSGLLSLLNRVIPPFRGPPLATKWFINSY